MSLINEALKKAQNQRAAGAAAQPTPPSVQSPESPPPLVRIPKRRPPLAARTLMGLVGTVLAGLIVIAAVGYFGYPSVSDQPAPVAPKPVVQVPAPAPPPPPAAPPISVSLPPIPGSTPTGVGTTTAEATPPPKPLAVPVGNPKIAEFIATLRVAGIRLSGTDPKVILNDRVYRANDLVDRTLQVRLSKIESTRLVFIDANGFEYSKSL